MVGGFAAAIDNSIGVVGIARCEVVGIRVADPDGNITDAAFAVSTG
jgi:hypothetical protein